MPVVDKSPKVQLEQCNYCLPEQSHAQWDHMRGCLHGSGVMAKKLPESRKPSYLHLQRVPPQKGIPEACCPSCLCPAGHSSLSPFPHTLRSLAFPFLCSSITHHSPICFLSSQSHWQPWPAPTSSLVPLISEGLYQLYSIAVTLAALLAEMNVYFYSKFSCSLTKSNSL